MLNLTQNDTVEYIFPEYSLPEYNLPLQTEVETDQQLPHWDELSDALYEFGRCESSDKAEARYHLQKSTLQFYTALVDDDRYRNALIENKYNLDDEEPMIRTLVAKNDLMRVDILSVSEKNPTPLHDNPGQSGIIMSVDGSATITQYGHTSSPISQAYPITKLNRIHAVQIDYGDAVALDPTWGNILELQSVRKRSVLLSIRYRCQLSTGNHWYFPITPKQNNHSSFFAQRIHRSGAQF